MKRLFLVIAITMTASACAQIINTVSTQDIYASEPTGGGSGAGGGGGGIGGWRN